MCMHKGGGTGCVWFYPCPKLAQNLQVLKVRCSNEAKTRKLLKLAERRTDQCKPETPLFLADCVSCREEVTWEQTPAGGTQLELACCQRWDDTVQQSAAHGTDGVPSTASRPAARRLPYHTEYLNSDNRYNVFVGWTQHTVKVKVGFLYSATYTANQNSTLHNLGSGSWLAIASGAAALCGLSTARANGHWIRGCSQRTHHRPNQPHQAFTLVSFRQVSPLQPK